MVVEVVEVSYLQHQVGAVSFDAATGMGVFKYDARFIQQGIELSPFKILKFLCSLSNASSTRR